MKKHIAAIGVLMISFFVSACGNGGSSSEPLFTVGGVVSGLSGTLLLQNNHSDDLTVKANGSFVFPTAMAPGSTYSVTVRTNPVGQTCTVANGAGTILISRVTNVSVDCSTGGGLDTAFNAPHGFVVQSDTAGGIGNDSGNGIAIDSSGRILVTGSSATTGGTTDMVVWRYKADGTLDSAFNGTGIVMKGNAAGGSGDDSGKAVAIDSDGKILVTGSSTTTGGAKDMVVWRFTTDGTLDSTFNGTGVVVHDGAAAGLGDESGNAITTDGQGRILVTGSTTSAGNTDMAVWRFNAKGTVDTSFNKRGIFVHNGAAGGDGADIGKAIVIDSSKRIVVAGSSMNSAGNADMVVWRLKDDGTLDTTLSGDGIFVQSGAAGGTSGDDTGNAIAIDSQGRILVAGSSTNIYGDTDMVVSRLTFSPVTLDTTFNGSGTVSNNGAAGSNGDDSGNGIAIDNQGRIIVTGSSKNSAGNTDMVVWRYKADGSLDITFADYGIFVHNNAAGGNGDDSGNAIALDTKGSILVTGSSTTTGGATDMVIWRVLP